MSNNGLDENMFSRFNLGWPLYYILRET